MLATYTTTHKKWGYFLFLKSGNINTSVHQIIIYGPSVDNVTRRIVWIVSAVYISYFYFSNVKDELMKSEARLVNIYFFPHTHT